MIAIDRSYAHEGNRNEPTPNVNLLRSLSSEKTSAEMAIHWIMIGMVTVALCISLYLSWAAATSTKIPGCGSGGIIDCDVVLQSRWSRLFGIPVGMFATGLYATMLVALLTSLRSRGDHIHLVSTQVSTTMAIAAGLAGLWFTSLQVFVVQHLCEYCLAVHTIGLTLAGLALWMNRSSLRPALISSMFALAGVGGLAMAQLMAEPPKTFEVEMHGATVAPDSESAAEPSDESIFSAPGFDSSPTGEGAHSTVVPSDQVAAPTVQLWSRRSLDTFFAATLIFGVGVQEAQNSTAAAEPAHEKKTSAKDPNSVNADDRRIVSVFGGRLRLDAQQWPLIGSPDAKYVLVEMFDYTCPHCRAGHQAVRGALDKLGKDLAIVELSVPMDGRCNPGVQATGPAHAEACEISALAVAVWRIDPAQFEPFHKWIFSESSSPSAASARQHAEQLVGKEKLAKELTTGVARQYVTRQIEMYQKIGAGTVPKLFLPSATLTGPVGSAEELIRIIQQQPTANK